MCIRDRLKALDLLACRREVQERGFVPPALPALRRYVQEGRPLSNDGLQAYLAVSYTHLDVYKRQANRQRIIMIG